MKRKTIVVLICVIPAFYIAVYAIGRCVARHSEIAPEPVISVAAPAPQPQKINQPAAYAKNLTDETQVKAVAYAQGVKDVLLAKAAEEKTERLMQAQARAATFFQDAKNTLSKAAADFSQHIKDDQAKIVAGNTAPSPADAQQARYRKAQADLAIASTQDQLLAAEIQKTYEGNGPFTSAQFRYLDEKTKWATMTYVPWALPPELQGATVTTIYIH